MYAYYKKLDYFSTECIYAPFAARGLAREYVKDVELLRPSAIVDIIQSAEQMRFSNGTTRLSTIPLMHGYFVTLSILQNTMSVQTQEVTGQNLANAHDVDTSAASPCARHACC